MLFAVLGIVVAVAVFYVISLRSTPNASIPVTESAVPLAIEKRAENKPIPAVVDVKKQDIKPKPKSPRPIQVITIGIGAENEEPGQVLQTTIPPPEPTLPVASELEIKPSSPSRDVNTARLPSTDDHSSKDTPSKDVATARSPQETAPVKQSDSPTKDVATARQPSNTEPTAEIDSKPSEDVETAKVITDSSVAALEEAKNAIAQQEAQAPSKDSLQTDITQKPEPPSGQTLATVPDPTNEPGEKKKKHKKKKKHNKSEKSGENENDEKKKKKKSKKSKDGKKKKSKKRGSTESQQSAAPSATDAAPPK